MATQVTIPSVSDTDLVIPERSHELQIPSARAVDAQLGFSTTPNQIYYTEVLTDFARQPFSENAGYIFDESSELHTFKVNNQDQVGSGNLHMLRGDFMQFTKFSLSVKIDSLDMKYDHEFFTFIDIHDSAQSQNEFDSGRTTAFRHPMTANVIYEDSILKYAIGLREDGQNKTYICKKPLTFGEWVDVEVTMVWGENPNGSVYARIGDVEESSVGISTSASNAFRYYPMWGIYQDGDIGDRGVETVIQIKNIRAGDDKSMFRVFPDYNRLVSAKGQVGGVCQPINSGSEDTD